MFLIGQHGIFHLVLVYSLTPREIVTSREFVKGIWEVVRGSCPTDAVLSFSM